MTRQPVLIRAFVALLSLLAFPASASTPRVVFAVEHAGWAGAGEVLQAGWASELLGGLSGLDNAGDVTGALGSVVGRRGRLAVVHDPSVLSGGGFGYGAMLQIDGGPGAVGQLAAWTLDQRFRSLLGSLQGSLGSLGGSAQPVESMAYPGQAEYWLPLVRVVFGPRQIGETWVFEVFLGAIERPNEVWSAIGWEGRSSLRLRVDPGGLEPALQLLEAPLTIWGANSGVPVGPSLGVLRALGLLGSEAAAWEIEGPGESASAWSIRVRRGERWTPLLGPGL